MPTIRRPKRILLARVAEAFFSAMPANSTMPSTSTAAQQMATVAPQSGAGLLILGYATGLNTELLLSGFVGGLWSLSQMPPSPPHRRVFVTIVSALVACYLSPVFAPFGLAAAHQLPDAMWALLQPAVPNAASVLVGFLSHLALGPGLIKITRRKMRDEAEK